MGVPHIILRNSENFKGIDKRSSDLQRTMEYATDVKNAAFRVSGAINKRKGFHSSIAGDSDDSRSVYGTFSYRVANTDGSIAEKILVVSNKLEEVRECVVHITNNRTGITNPDEDAEILISHYLNKATGTFKFKVSNLANTENYYEVDLGTGKSINDLTS